MQSPSLWLVRSCGRPLQRTPRHGANQIEPEFGIGVHIFQRIDGLGGGFRRGAEDFRAGFLPGESGFGLRNSAWASFGAAQNKDIVV